MASICYKKAYACKNCEYYRYDENYGSNTCWKDHDLKRAHYLIGVGETKSTIDPEADCGRTEEECLIKLATEYDHHQYQTIYQAHPFKLIYIRRNPHYEN